jgi:L-ascorbate metabolism protein UlaG (beta-lactamase superfamily)
VKPDLAEFLRDDGSVKFIWFGHSTILIRMQGKTVLFDPVFSGAASPVFFANRRFQPPVLPLRELPPIDFVVISHDHYDHLDHETVEFFADAPATKFVMPLGNASYLEGWGIPRERIVELDWWESHEWGGMKFTCTPAQHFSGRRGIWGQNATLWASWSVQAGGRSVYFSGDTGYDIHFAKVGESLGPFDLTFIENGQYDAMWSLLHLMPGEQVRAFRDLRGKLLVPIHWGMFNMAFHAWNEPVEKLNDSASSEGVPLLVPRLGEVLRADTPLLERAEWWLTSHR